MACIRKVKGRTGYVYHIDFSYRGKRFVKTTKTSELSVAKQILKDIEGKIARGIFDLETFEDKSVLLSSFIEQYFKYAKNLKSPATLVNEKNYTEKFIKYFGNVQMYTITVKNLDLWRSEMLAQVSPTTFNIERRTLQAIFEVAVRWDLIKTNPFKKIQKAKVEEKRLFMEQSEFEKIIKRIDQDISSARSSRDRRFLDKFKAFILFSVNTGMRRSEVLRLKRGDIDIKSGVIHIVVTKSKKTRVVPLNTMSRYIIESIGDDLFGRLNANHVTRKFNYYLGLTGLQQFKLHSLRHTFATNLIRLGVDVYTVSRLLGHSDIRTTLVYAKMKDEVLKDAVNKLSLPTAVTIPAIHPQ